MTREQREELTRPRHRHVGRARQRAARAARARRWTATRRCGRGSRARSASSASPREARTIADATADLDVRELLPSIRVPDAGHAPPRPSSCGTCATRATWPSTSPAPATSSSTGADSFPFLGDSEAIVEEIAEFLTGGAHRHRPGARPADGDVHRHRRRHRARGEARRRPLARPARPARRDRARRARALRRARGQDGRRRLPGDLRGTPLARAALRAGDQPRRCTSSSSRSGSGSTPASAS